AARRAPPTPRTPPAPPRPPPAERAAPPPVSASRIQPDPKQTECVERWLEGHGLPHCGNPPGSMYHGGTAPFGETPGRSVDRWTLVAKNRPEALQSCAVPVPP